MDLLPNDEQHEIIESVRSLLASNHTIGEVPSDALWDLATEQGWFGLGLSETLGGVGYSIVESALVAAELGNVGLCADLLPTIIAAFVATDAAPELVTGLIGGLHRCALGYRLGQDWVAAGSPDCDLLLLLDTDGAAFVHTEHCDAGTTVASLDVTMPLTHRRIEVELTPLSPAIGSGVDVLVASFCAGIARATTTQSVDYAKDRQQFGQPIGSFQGVKHRCADMATRSEAAESIARYASLALRDNAADAQVWATNARIVASSAAIDNSQINIQNHGGIGFTWEHTAHRYVTAAQFAVRIAGSLAHSLHRSVTQPS